MNENEEAKLIVLRFDEGDREQGEQDHGHCFLVGGVMITIKASKDRFELTIEGSHPTIQSMTA